MDIYNIVLGENDAASDIAVFPDNKSTSAFAIPCKNFAIDKHPAFNMDSRYISLQEWINEQNEPLSAKGRLPDSHSGNRGFESP